MALQLLRLGEGPDILFPGGHAGELHRYLDSVRKSGLFAEQDAQLAHLRRSPVARAAGDDGRPLVGIMLSEAAQLVPHAHHALTQHIARVHEMGARPVLLPPVADLQMGADRAHTIRAQAALLDGLIGPGGADVDPRIYGAVPTFSLSTNYQRDRYEADVALAAMDARCFMLGICRSHQLWNAATGGWLHQDVRKNGRSLVSQNQLDYDLPFSQPFVLKRWSGAIAYENRIVVARHSQAALALGVTDLVPNSLHHQAVARPGAFFVVGTAADPHTGKRTIEMTERWNAMTLQFHPEYMPSDIAQRRLYDVLGRRSLMFRMLREQKGPSNLIALERRMRSAQNFLDADFRWLRANNAHLR